MLRFVCLCCDLWKNPESRLFLDDARSISFRDGLLIIRSACSACFNDGLTSNQLRGYSCSEVETLALKQLIKAFVKHVGLVPVLIGKVSGIFLLLVINLVEVFAGWLLVDVVSLGEILSLFNALFKHLLHESLVVIILIILIVFVFVVVFRVSWFTGVGSTIRPALLVIIDVFPSFFAVLVTFVAIRIVNKLAIFVVLKLCGPLLFEALELRVAERGPLCVVHVAHRSLKCLLLGSLVDLGSHQLLIALVTLLRVGESVSCLFLVFGLGSTSLLFNIKKAAVQSHLSKLNSHINDGCKMSLGGLVSRLEVQVSLVLG